ncbi:MAG: hypothetical protein HQK54_06740 [Oligoflexales bacterium]|nr:hypothetical protein [Oligoflexales bacterium]
MNDFFVGNYTLFGVSLFVGYLICALTILFFQHTNLSKRIFVHVTLGIIFSILTYFFINFNYSMSHDAIEWQGVYHYFYSSIASGVFPLWNPFSQMGTPFYQYYQCFGLLLPTNFIVIGLQKIFNWSTLTSYIIHYFLLYYIFILGSFFVFKLFLVDTAESFVFSLFLLISTFPMFMLQNGTLNSSFLIPFSCYLILTFSSCKDKILSFSLIAIITGFSLNIYIPVWYLFFAFFLTALLLIFKQITWVDITSIFSTKRNIILISTSTIIAIFLVSPVLSLHFDLSTLDTEFFPGLRLLQYNGNTLFRFFASDVGAEIFSEELTHNMKVSNTLLNFIGLVTEPTPRPSVHLESEVLTYVGVIPLALSFYSIVKHPSRYVYIFAIISVISTIILFNFGISDISQATIGQQLMITIFPLLGLNDVLENIGPIFIFSLFILSSIGYRQMKIRYFLRNGSFSFASLFLGLAFLAIFLKYFLYFGTMVLYVFLPTFMMFLFFEKKIFRHTNRSMVMHLMIMTTFIDLLAFASFHSFSYQGWRVIKQDYTDYLVRTNMRNSQVSSIFSDRREPFGKANSSRSFLSFFGKEIFENTKIAYINAFVVSVFPKGVPVNSRWDHFFSTKYYYDFIVNINISQHRDAGAFLVPLIDFFSSSNLRKFSSKYDLAREINRSLDLANEIYVEENVNFGIEHQKVKINEILSHPVNYSQKNIDHFKLTLDGSKVPDKHFSYVVLESTLNSLKIEYDVSEAGYIRFADGYSKHWTARLNGKVVPILKTNINFKSVYTPPGKHTLDFSYRPTSYLISLIFYFIGLLATIIFLSHMLRKRSGKYISH